MEYAVSAILALVVASGAASVLSLFLFDDYREGFRIIFHSFSSPDIADPPLPPQEPKASGTAQIAFIGAILVVAFLSFASAYYWLKRLGV